jgi:hypothetical protein
MFCLAESFDLYKPTAAEHLDKIKACGKANSY